MLGPELGWRELTETCKYIFRPQHCRTLCRFDRRTRTAARASGPDHTRLIRENVLDKAQSVISTTPSDYRTIVADLGDRGLLDGIVYDALIAFAAQKLTANAIVTLNGGNFRRLPWPVGAKIIEPS